MASKTSGVDSGIFTSDIMSDNDLGLTFKANSIYNRYQNNWFTRFNRFGCVDPYTSMGTTHEYLFFTKPDLNFYIPGTQTLNPQLQNNSFFVEMANRFPEVLAQLQQSVYPLRSSNYYPFMNILSNTVKNTLDLPEVNSEDIDNNSTIYGSSITYRGDGFSANEGHEFTLEFEDTKYSEVYHLFKAMDEYAQLNHVGLVDPPNIDSAKSDSDGNVYSYYKRHKILNDQFGIYKIIVDETMEDILYYAYLAGCYAKTVPRDSYSDLKPEGGLRHTVTFKSQFIYDMEPWILANFNTLISKSMAVNGEVMEIYNPKVGMIDGRWAAAPIIAKVSQQNKSSQLWNGPKTMQYSYKLKWRMK